MSALQMEEEGHAVKFASIQMEPFPVAVIQGSLSLDMLAMVKLTSTHKYGWFYILIDMGKN